MKVPDAIGKRAIQRKCLNRLYRLVSFCVKGPSKQL